MHTIEDVYDILNTATFTESEGSDMKRSNANVDTDSPMGAMLTYGSETARLWVDDCLLDEDTKNLVDENLIYIHDKDFYGLTETCCQIELDKLFKGGFDTGHGHIREPQSIGTAAALACIAIQSNQNDQHGGQSIPAFDYYMAPYVRKTYDKKVKHMTDVLSRLGVEKGDYEKITDLAWEETVNETEQAMEALIHNLNTMHSRAGAQVPFSSLNYGTDTSCWGRLVTASLLKATEAGLGEGETPIFPVQIFKVKEGVNYNVGDPNYDLFRYAMQVSGERLFPNFSFIDAPFNIKTYQEGKPMTEVAYMGCRTRVVNDVNGEAVVGGRGNLSFTSINLVGLALESGGNYNFFTMTLYDVMEGVAKQLLHRFKLQSARHVYNYPFLMGNGVWIGSENLLPEDTVGEVLKHGTLSIGFIGLAEAMKYIFGKHHGEDEEVQKKALETVQFMRDFCDQYTRETGLNFTLLATPAEGLSGKFVKKDRERYGLIEGVTDREYYTNSFHVPVYYPTSIEHKIDVEAPYHALCNAGHISYVEVDGNIAANIDAFEQIIRYMHDAGVGYGSINHPVDRCPVCGYTGIIGDECPRCHRKEYEMVPEAYRYLVK